MSIEYPIMDPLNEEQRAATAIGRVSGALTAEIVEGQIAARRELLVLIEAGLDEPICPELTNANPSSPHTVLLEAISWTLAQQAYRFNRVPEQNLIAFANLFGIERKPATKAETTLRFEIDPPLDTAVTIPAGTEVASDDAQYVFETTASVTIPYANRNDIHDIKARRTIAGQTLLQPDVLTVLIDPVAYVEDVTNPSAVDSGTEIEPLEATLMRVRRYQKRGERIVSTKDLEEAILDEALDGNGVVRAFPFVKNGEYLQPLKIGHTTVVVMTRTGNAIDAIARQRIGTLLDTAVGNQFIYVVDPQFIDFDVEASLVLNTGSPEGEVLTAVEANLRNFYAAKKEQFGRPILRSEIIMIIEGTEGVDRIFVVPPVVPGTEVPDPERITQNTPILTQPSVDTFLREYQLPRLDDVTLHVQ